MEFTVNGITFIVDSYPSGFSWVTKDDESADYFTCRYMAQQDAIDYVKRKMIEEEIENQRRLEDEIYGTYEEQVKKLYYETR